MNCLMAALTAAALLFELNTASEAQEMTGLTPGGRAAHPPVDRTFNPGFKPARNAE